MGVPLEVTVEIGRTRKKVQDILSFAKGSLVILDKLAGDQVDLFVNGKCMPYTSASSSASSEPSAQATSLASPLAEQEPAALR
mgnify:CR=1 FL=1